MRVKALDVYRKRSINRMYHTMQAALSAPLLGGVVLTVGGYMSGTGSVWVLIIGMVLLSVTAAGMFSVELSRREQVRLISQEGWE